MTKILAFGTFDKLHPGHLYFLKKAKSFGDFLSVVVALDKTVEEVKGKKPRNNEQKRLSEIKKLDFVDEAMLGKEGDKYEIIGEIKPGVICLGYDQDSFSEHLQDELLKRNINAKIIRLDAYQEHKYKSSRMS